EVDGFEIINGKLLTTKLIYLPKDTILTTSESDELNTKQPFSLIQQEQGPYQYQEVDGFEIINGKLLTTKLIYLPKDTILTTSESGFRGPFC
ncbi:1953_t:CDS:2, partial [Entrophospora sp. SA101]